VLRFSVVPLLAIACAGGAGSVPAATGPEDAVRAARAHRERQGATILRDFAAMLALPNTPDEPEGLVRNAEALAERFAARGVATEVWTQDGAPPVVYGRIDVPAARRTIGIYAHYDGQPVDPARWAHPPFEPTLYTGPREAGGTRRALPAPGEAIDPEWRIYARSAGDDKAPFAALLAALDALGAAGLEPTSNVVFLFDGEEERGSPHLATYLARHRERLRVDAWLFADGPVHTSRRPQLVFGVRGVTGLELTVYGPLRALHSGHYGNWAPNPALRLAQLVASMVDGQGRVLIAGFYDTTRPPTPEERAMIARLPDDDAALREELGLAATEGQGAPRAERLLLPALNVRGLEAGGVGAQATNAIPAQATASIDLRLVPGNDPAAMLDLVERHVRAQGYHVIDHEPDRATRLAHPRLARIEREGGYPAVRTSPAAPVVREIIAAAEAAAGPEPLALVPSLGGSLPLQLFLNTPDRPIVIVPLANHDDNQHAADENLRLANLWYGIDLFAALLHMSVAP